MALQERIIGSGTRAQGSIGSALAVGEPGGFVRGGRRQQQEECKSGGRANRGLLAVAIALAGLEGESGAEERGADGE